MKIICFLFDPNVGGPTIRARSVYERMIAQGYDVRIAIPSGEGTAESYFHEKAVPVDRLAIAKPVLPRKVALFLKFAFTAPISLLRLVRYLGIALQFAAISRMFMQQVVRLQSASIAVSTKATVARSEMLRLIGRALVAVVLGGGALAVLVGFSANVILTSFFDGKYQPAIPVVWVLTAWVTVLGCGLIINRFVIGSGLQAYAFVAGLVMGLISVFLVYTLADDFGVLGYAWILVIGHGTSVLAQFLILMWEP